MLTNPCKNGATCTDFFGGYICRCIYGWEGFDCSINKDDCKTSDGTAPCLSGGTCVDKVGKYDCLCPPGKTGTICNDIYIYIYIFFLFYCIYFINNVGSIVSFYPGIFTF